MSGATYGPQFEIDAIAKRHLDEVTRSNWILREWRPDTFIDYTLELRTPAEPTGKLCFLQLKGQQVLQSDDTNVRVVMATKHLQHYHSAARLPVFLVVVDTTRRKGYYLFVQKWLTDSGAATRLKEQESLTVLVPLANELEVHPQLVLDVESAITWMQDRYPGRPEAAVAHVEDYYGQLDRRFDVQVTVSSKERTIHVSAKEPVTLGLTLGTDPENARRLQERLEWGKSVKAEGSISIKGSALFEEFCRTQNLGGFEFAPAVTIPCTFKFEARLKGKRVDCVVPAVMTGGPRGTAVESTDQECPLHAELRIAWSKPGGPIMGHINTGIHLERWIGKDLKIALRYRAFADFAEAVQNGATIRVSVIGQHRRFEFQLPAKKCRMDHLKHRAWWIVIMSHAAQVAARYGLQTNMPRPDEVREADLGKICSAYESLTKDRLRRPWIDIALEEENAEFRPIIADVDAKGSVAGKFRGVFPFVVRIFGAEREIGLLEIESTPCRVTRVPGAASNTGPVAIRIQREPRGSLELWIRRDADAVTSFGFSGGDMEVERPD